MIESGSLASIAYGILGGIAVGGVFLGIVVAIELWQKYRSSKPR